MNETYDKAFRALLSVAEDLGFVSDRAKNMLRAVVSEILDDPRNEIVASRRAEPQPTGEIPADLIAEPGPSDPTGSVRQAVAEERGAPTITWCENNDCESPTCHRCFPRVGCHDHEKCGHATITGTAYSDDEAKSLGRTVTCKLCGKDTPEATAHLHQSAYVGECCWDDRLKATE